MMNQFDGDQKNSEVRPQDARPSSAWVKPTVERVAWMKPTVERIALKEALTNNFCANVTDAPMSFS